MHEKLVKRLRAVADGKREEKCDGCPYEEDYPCCVDCLDTLHKQAADALEKLEAKLAAYEEAEEQGLLVRLPCKVGDKVFWLWPCGKHGKSVSEMVVKHIDIDFMPDIEFACFKEKGSGGYWFFKSKDIGKTVFLTREEAEAALKGETKDV